MQLLSSIFTILATGLSFSYSWYSDVAPGTEYCIMEMSEQDHGFKVAYKLVKGMSRNCNLRMTELSDSLKPAVDSDGHLLATESVKINLEEAKKGSHASFISHLSGGWVRVCVSCDSAVEATVWELSFDVVADQWMNSMMDPTNNGQDVAQDKETQSLVKSFSTSIDKVVSINSMVNTMKKLDIDMRDKMETIHDSLLYSQGLLLALVIATLLYQGRSIIRFLRVSKII